MTILKASSLLVRHMYSFNLNGGNTIISNGFVLLALTSYDLTKWSLLHNTVSLLLYCWVSFCRMLVTLVLISLVGASMQAGLPGSFVPVQTNTGDQTQAFVKPPFCHDLDCPKYTLMETQAVRLTLVQFWLFVGNILVKFTNRNRIQLVRFILEYLFCLSAMDTLHSLNNS